VDAIQEVWARADAENRDLTAAERIHMSELVAEAKSQHDIEKSIRELDVGGPSFAKATDPNHSFAGGGPGRRVRQVSRLPEDRRPVRPRPDVDHRAG
jgi:hypothetical protein